jgi:hypothetical protein
MDACGPSTFLGASTFATAVMPPYRDEMQQYEE